MNTIKELIDKLKQNNQGCSDQCLDLKRLNFDGTPGEIRLYNDLETFYFKHDPEKPKNPKTVHAANQFCKIIGVPFGFLYKNPEHIRKTLVDCWLPSVKQEQATVLAKLRKGAERTFFRAILPVEYTNISNLEIVEKVAEAAGECFTINFDIGVEPDDPVLYVRFLSNEKFEAFSECCSMGFSVTCSELGCSDLIVDTFIQRDLHGTSLLASYGNEAFFVNDYRKIQPKDLVGLFPQLVSHMRFQLPKIKEKIQVAKELGRKGSDIQALLKDLKGVKGLSERFHNLLVQDIANNMVENKWDFANRVAMVAKNFEISKRLKMERVAGNLVGLSFEKN